MTDTEQREQEDDFPQVFPVLGKGDPAYDGMAVIVWPCSPPPKDLWIEHPQGGSRFMRSSENGVAERERCLKLIENRIGADYDTDRVLDDLLAAIREGRCA